MVNKRTAPLSRLPLRICDRSKARRLFWTLISRIDMQTGRTERFDFGALIYNLLLQAVDCSTDIFYKKAGFPVMGSRFIVLIRYVVY
jgi:hypothetical protein